MFIEKVLGGAFTLIVIFSTMTFALWMIVEHFTLVYFFIMTTFFLVIYYLNKAPSGSKQNKE